MVQHYVEIAPKSANDHLVVPIPTYIFHARPSPAGFSRPQHGRGRLGGEKLYSLYVRRWLVAEKRGDGPRDSSSPSPVPHA